MSCNSRWSFARRIICGRVGSLSGAIYHEGLATFGYDVVCKDLVMLTQVSDLCEVDILG